MASSLGVFQEEREAEFVGSAFRVQNILKTRANAFAMCGACHLGSWQTYVKRFMGHYTTPRSPRTTCIPRQAKRLKRPIGLQLQRFSLCVSTVRAWVIPSTISPLSAIFCAAFSHLCPRPRSQTDLRSQVLSRGDRDGVRGRPELPQKWVAGPNSDGVSSKRPRTGECFDWIDGKCEKKFCKWMHHCAQCGSTSLNCDCRARLRPACVQTFGSVSEVAVSAGVASERADEGVVGHQARTERFRLNDRRCLVRCCLDGARQMCCKLCENPGWRGWRRGV